MEGSRIKPQGHCIQPRAPDDSVVSQWSELEMGLMKRRTIGASLFVESCKFGNPPIQEAEATALMETMNRVHDLYLQNVIFELDCKQASNNMKCFSTNVTKYEGALKCNVDASIFTDTTKFRMEATVRDVDGLFISAQTSTKVGILSIAEFEASALLEEIFVVV
ncbi:hypothetical protein JHK84_040079 [Glycine max]|nr:hypothetical protein JHK86_039866 [Glycine max]KAG4965473.1 hypothetical protein JHK85_040448 [Glycine max]KAG5121739.1 hypothetical protein JHK84_040079 [Glycine max]